MVENDGCIPSGENDLEASIASDPDLIAAGWTRRYLADPDRAREAVALYTSLGYQVKEQKLSAGNFSKTCGDCHVHVCQSYVLIYTRKASD